MDGRMNYEYKESLAPYKKWNYYTAQKRKWGGGGKEEKSTIGLVGRMLANPLGDRGSISGRVIPKTQKMVLDAA